MLEVWAQSNARVAGATDTDKALINCVGNAIDAASTAGNDLMVDVFYVDMGSDNEPSLMCSVGTILAMRPGTQPVVHGVDSFQVLYGVTPRAAPMMAADSVADRYLRADQLVVPGDEAATLTNWQRVRSLRIGMVLRGPVGSLQDRSRATVLYPQGMTLAPPDDVGSIFTALDDCRLRQTLREINLHSRAESWDLLLATQSRMVNTTDR